MSRTRVCVLAALLAAFGCGDRAPEAPGTASDRADSQRRAFQETGGQGLWAVPRPRAGEDRKQLAERLFALGYLDGMRPAEGVEGGVTVYDRSRAWNSVNLYVAGHAEEANLIDMQGRVVHKWTFDIDKLGLKKGSGPTGRYFRHAAVFPNGDLLALYDSRALVKLDKDSNLLWSYTSEPHHQFEVLPNNDVMVLTAKRRFYAPWHPKRMVVDNYIVRLDSSGKEMWRTSIIEAIHKSPVKGLWDRVMEQVPTKMGELGDVLHGNSIQMLDPRLASKVPLVRPGFVVVSLPIIHSVVVVDPLSKRVVWAWQGDFRFQHHAHLLPTGKLMLFDNQRGPDEQSAVLEVDPLTNRVVWSYRGTPEHPFYSWCCGTCYRLPNGNTLIVETEGGRAFEVTAGGEMVWEFTNPHRAGQNHDLIAQMFDLVRLEPRQYTAWLTLPPPPPP